MGNCQSDTKKKNLMISFAILATVFAVYMAICDYAGMSGNIAYLQHMYTWIYRQDFVSFPRWFAHGTLSGMLVVLFLYAIYRTKCKNKRYGILILCLFIPYLINALFSPSSPEHLGPAICMGIITCGMFAAAIIPGTIGRAITRKLVVQNSDIENDPGVFCRDLLRRIEWIRFFPLKKVLIGAMWLFLSVISICGFVAFCKNPQPDDFAISFLLLVVAVCTFRKVWRYVRAPYHCVPVLNQVLSKRQIESLMQEERFELISFENEDLQKYVTILLSENWALIDGLLISRKLAHQIDTHISVIPGKRTHYITVTYINGRSFSTKALDFYLKGNSLTEMFDTLKRIRKSPYQKCSSEKLLQKYNAILPEITDPTEKLWHLLTHDISQIEKADDVRVAPKAGAQKMKRSEKHADRKRNKHSL